MSFQYLPLVGSDWESELDLIKDECEECEELPLGGNASLLGGGCSFYPLNEHFYAEILRATINYES